MSGAADARLQDVSGPSSPGASGDVLGERVELGRAMSGAHYWKIVVPGTAESAVARALEIDAQLTTVYGPYSLS